jgi:hypothetical protein
MRKKAFIIALSLVVTASCVIYIPRTPERYPGPEEEYYEEDYPIVSPSVDLSQFYDSLSPYGMWMVHPTYAYVWIPTRTRLGWRPYTDGQWVWTDHGWTWISSFKWGWLPFHYGRWGWEKNLGWFWIPDTVWGPAWVTWRWGNLYVGWAPLPPEAIFITGIGIDHLPYALPHEHWVFVEPSYFLNSRLYRYLLPVERNITIINYTVLRTDISVRNGMIINRGIQTDDLRRVIKSRISKYELREMDQPGQTKVRMNDVEVFRPTVIKKEELRPKEVLERDEVQKKREEKAIEEWDETVSIDEREENLKKIHEREKQLLERTQIKEIKEADKNLQRKKQAVRTPSEEEQVEKKHKEEMEKLKEDHKKEKTHLQERHNKEEEEVKKKTRRKKIP